MKKRQFNNKAEAKILNEYVLTLTESGVTSLRGSRGHDKAPQYQALLFREKLVNWLESKHEYERHNVLTTSVLPPSAEGLPRISLTATHTALQRVQKQFSSKIVSTDMVRKNVSSSRIIKRPGTESPPADIRPVPDKLRDDPKSRSDYFRRRRGF